MKILRQGFIILLSLLLLCCSCGRRDRRGAYSRNQIVRSSGTSRRASQPNRRNVNSKRSKTTIQTLNSNNGELTGADLFELYNSAVFMIYTSDGWNDYQGSGFFISRDGVAVSNYHVFQGTGIGYEQILLSDGSKRKVKEVIAKSSADDIIVFRVEGNGKTFNYIPIAKQTPRVGEKAYAIGSPRGLENTFSSGEISQIRGDNLLQINVPIDHGSSGGVLLNARGEAIGITSAGMDNSGANLNFAIDINVLKKYVKLPN
jgi:serine protease Do